MKKKHKRKITKLLGYKTLDVYVKNKNIPRTVKPSMDKVPALMRELATHFKKDKWPLSYDHIRSELFRAMTGVDDMAFIVRELSKRNVHVGWGDDPLVGSVLYLDAPKGKKK